MKKNRTNFTVAAERASASLVALCAIAAPATSLAERWAAIGSIDGTLTATDNGNFDDRAAKESDVYLRLVPRVSVRGDGARLRLNGSASVSAVTYANGTQRSEVVPTADFSLWLEAIEGLFFIESSAGVDRTIDSPFGPQAADASRINSQDRYRARVSPYFAGNLGSRWRYLLRHDSSWTRSSGGTSDLADQYAHRQTAELALTPRPVGASLTFDRDESKGVEGTIGRRTSEIARLIVTFGSEPQFVFGLRAGHEKNNYPGFNSERDFYGANLTWRPTDRTNLSLVGEKRFFGNAWQASFDHRMPRLAWTVRSSRGVNTLPQRLLGLPATLDVAALIDASLTTRIPDPVERARAVEDLIVSRGLPRSLVAPVDIFNERIEVQTAHSGTITLLGARNALALTVFQTRTEGLDNTLSGAPLSTSLLDNRQRGTGLTFSRQVTPRTTVNAEASWRQTRGLGSLRAEDSRQQIYQLRFSRLLSPKTTFTAGTRYQVFNSTIETDANEAAVFVGLGHRF